MREGTLKDAILKWALGIIAGLVCTVGGIMINQLRAIDEKLTKISVTIAVDDERTTNNTGMITKLDKRLQRVELYYLKPEDLRFFRSYAR